MTLPDQQWIQMYLLERRTLLVAIVCVLIAVLIWPFGIMPLWNRYSDAQAQTRRLKAQVTQVGRRADILQQLDSSTRDSFRRAEVALPLQKQPFSAVLGLNEIASKSGALLVSYDLNPGVVSTGSAELANASKSSTGVQSFPLGISLQGSFAQLQEAFRLMETNLPLLEIVEYSITPDGKASGEAALVRSDITIRMFSASLQVSDFAKATAVDLTPAQQSTIEKLRTFTISEAPSLLPTNGLKFNNTDYLSE